MFTKNRLWVIMLIVFMVMLSAAGCTRADREVILATTTSTTDSGLLDVLKPEFDKQTGYDLTIVSVGSGAAIAMGEKGEADALLVHSPKDEQRIEDAGVVVDRQLVMHNDFVLVGPAGDPAGIKRQPVEAAFKAIAEKKALFLSRGDESGTHKKELGVWDKAGITPAGEWYQETGTGMGATLNVAAEKKGYTLTDRATYLALQENMDLQILLEGDQALLNIYHVMQVNPEKFEKVNAEGGKAFVDFMAAPETQEIIKTFGADKYGQPLFFPDAGKKG